MFFAMLVRRFTRPLLIGDFFCQIIHFYIAFIMSKSRVTSKTNTAILQLESQTAVLATKLAKLITKEHDMSVIKRFFLVGFKHHNALDK